MARQQAPRDASQPVSRRFALQKIGLGLGAAAFASACVPPDRCEDGPTEPSPGQDFDESGVPTARRLLAGIDTFVVMMMENRSFDHFFGMLALDPDYPARSTIDGLKGSETNQDKDGTPVLIHRTDGVQTHGPRHDWEGAHLTFAEGRNDGFVRNNTGPSKADSMSYHDRSQLPLMYALADQYVVCDRWFASVMGPTWPNRFFLHAASSEGKIQNDPITNSPPTIWEKLGKNCWSSKCYAAGPAHWYYAAFRGRPMTGNDPMTPAFIEDFFRDAANGNLPNFSLIDPDFWSSDLHPPHSLALGEALVGAIVRAMQQSPQWASSLLIVVFDEHGGFFDHVPPPTTIDPRPHFRQLGFRVPALVIGPTVRAGQVVSSTFDHVSIAATLKTRFGIESLGPRMDATADLSPCIDPERIGLPTGPVGKLPSLDIHRRRVVQASVQFTSQPGLDAALRAGHIPPHLIDPREPEARLRSLLRYIQHFEVAKVRG